MKRILILTLAAGAVTAVGVGIGMHAAESGHRGDGFHRGSHGGWGHGGGHRWGHRGRRGKHRMLRRFDANKDGKLTQQEIDDTRRDLVTKHDSDGNGQLTLEEYKNLWMEMRGHRVVRSFQRLDEDGDAIVTIEEFLEPFSRIVERMDRNDDGVLDKQDRRRRGWRHHRRGDRGDHGERRRGGDEGSEGEDGTEQ